MTPSLLTALSAIAIAPDERAALASVLRGVGITAYTVISGEARYARVSTAALLSAVQAGRLAIHRRTPAVLLCMVSVPYGDGSVTWIIEAARQ